MPHRKSVLITGANRGIGREVARQLAQQGWKVWLGCRSKESGEEVAAELKGTDVLELDVTDPKKIRRAIGVLERLDVLVNNAGVYSDDESILETRPDMLQDTIKVNTLGPLLMAQEVWSLLEKSHHARIINVSSGYGQLQDMTDERPAYCISKTALNAVTCQLADAGRRCNIAVNSVCPGWVRTDMGGKEAPRSVEQGAETIVWLAASAPQDLTGRFLRDREPIPW